MKRQRAIAIGLLGAMVAMGACASDSPAEVNASRGTATTSASEPPPEAAIEYVRRGLNTIANLTDAAVIGRVEAVGALSWNSADGVAWPGDQQQGAIKFRDIAVAVEEVLYASTTLSPSAGERLTIRSIGEGPAAQDPNPGVLDDDEWSGRYVAGARMALLLAKVTDFPYEGGRTEEILQVPGGFSGAWTIVDRNGRRFGENIDRNWNAPLDVIMKKFHEERAAGRDPARDERTIHTLLTPDEAAAAGQG